MDSQQNFLAALLKNERDIKAFIGSIVHDQSVRDDVFQDVVLTLWERLGEYDPQRPFGAWARGVATNKILQRRHQDRRFPAVFAPEAIQVIREAFDRTEAAASARGEALEKCVETLAPQARELLRLRYGEGLKVPQVAQRVNRTVAAAYQALCRVRAALTECIRRRLAAEQ